MVCSSRTGSAFGTKALPAAGRATNHRILAYRAIEVSAGNLMLANTLPHFAKEPEAEVGERPPGDGVVIAVCAHLRFVLAVRETASL
jgi:hypothetical protein